MPSHADNIRLLLAEIGVKAGIVSRKRQQVVYVKDSEQIAQVLEHRQQSGRLHFENARILGFAQPSTGW